MISSQLGTEARLDLRRLLRLARARSGAGGASGCLLGLNDRRRRLGDGSSGDRGVEQRLGRLLDGASRGDRARGRWPLAGLGQHPVVGRRAARAAGRSPVTTSIASSPSGSCSPAGSRRRASGSPARRPASPTGSCGRDRLGTGASGGLGPAGGRAALADQPAGLVVVGHDVAPGHVVDELRGVPAPSRRRRGTPRPASSGRPRAARRPSSRLRLDVTGGQPLLDRLAEVADGPVAGPAAHRGLEGLLRRRRRARRAPGWRSP